MALTLSAIIFDMDGLLLDTEPVFQRVWTASLAAFGKVLTPEMFLQLLGRGRKGALIKVDEIFGVTFPRDQLLAEIEKQELYHFESSPLQLKPGVREILHFVAEREIPRMVATSTRRKVAEKRLQAAHILSSFYGIVAGDEVTNSKPAPDIFLAAANKLGVAAQGCVVLEDSESGIRGAHAAGMIPVMIPDLLTPTPEIRTLARAVLPNLSVAQEWIKNEFLI